MKTIWRVSVICGCLVICVLFLCLSKHQLSHHKLEKRPQRNVWNNSEDSSNKDCTPPLTIPAFMYDVIDEIVEKDEFELPHCIQTKIKKNLVFIKTHKCASDTLSAIFRRFALDHNLNVILPVGSGFLLGWPHQMTSYMYRPRQKGGEFNLIVDHSVYNRTYMSRLMPPDTVYMTSYREPADRLTSALTYFAVAKCGLMNKDLVESKDRVKITREFLNNMDHYDTVYKSIENLYSLEWCGCIPNGISMVKNAMAFDMGFPVGYHMGTVDQQQNYVFIINWLKQVHQEFPVFILTNYFAECMVLLKRYMCWPMKSILYKKLNDWKTPKPNYPEEQIAAYRNWTNVDTLLYDMFHKLYQKRVAKLGQDFEDETSEYLNQLDEAMRFCRGNKLQLDMAATLWNQPYIVTRKDCEHMQDRNHLRDKLKALYDMDLPETYKGVLEEAHRSRYMWC